MLEYLASDAKWCTRLRIDYDCATLVAYIVIKNRWVLYNLQRTALCELTEPDYWPAEKEARLVMESTPIAIRAYQEVDCTILCDDGSQYSWLPDYDKYVLCDDPLSTSIPLYIQ